MTDLPPIQEIVERAIRFEEESVQLYANAALAARNGHVKARLEELAAEERSHVEKLENLRTTNIRWAIRRSRTERGTIPDLKLAETLAPRELGPDADAQDVMVVAMQREKAAAEFYFRLCRNLWTIPWHAACSKCSPAKNYSTSTTWKARMKRLSTKPFDDNQESLIPMTTNNYRANILVCGGTGCTASGAHGLVDNLQAEINRQGLARDRGGTHGLPRLLRDGPGDDESTRTTSSATATRATPARSWTVACSRAIRTACSRA